MLCLEILIDRDIVVALPIGLEEKRRAHLCVHEFCETQKAYRNSFAMIGRSKKIWWGCVTCRRQIRFVSEHQFDPTPMNSELADETRYNSFEHCDEDERASREQSI